LALRRPLASVLLLAAIAALPLSARAQGKLEARYQASLAGIPVGKGNWIIDITDTHYAASASGTTTGLVRAFTGGEGTSAVHGLLRAGQPVTSTYASTIVSGHKADEVHLTVANGVAKDVSVDPPLEVEPDRVPITDETRKGILDPMTASLLRTPGTGNPLSPEACHRTLSVFDGRYRYDLQFVFKRLDHVKAEKGYAGPVVVCAVYFMPIAGFIPSRSAIRYITKLRDIEAWLAPIAGTRVLVPFRVQGPTPIGRMVLQATEFVSTPVAARAAVNGTKTQ
jgi:hypothetical protein